MKSKILSLIAIVVFVGCQSSDPAFRATELGENMPRTDFTLTDQHGTPFTLSENRGKVVLLFFGFTYCPDVCPATLSNWKRVQETLQNESAEIKFVYITVDPERDTPEKMQQHLSIFSPDFIGLTGTTEELQSVYSTYGIYREKVKISDSAAGYIINHTSRMYVIDRNGRWRLGLPHDAPVADIVHDIRILLAEEQRPVSIRVENIWSRPAHAADNEADKMSSTGVIYLTIINEGSESDRFIRVQSDIAEAVELHESKTEDGRMRMQMLGDGVEVPAKGRVEFQPGGYHIMLIGLNRSLNPGDRFNVMLEFEKGGARVVESEVRQP